jgi:hypothetical protein
MRQVILIARDDDGQPCSNEAWADQVRYLGGVERVDVVSIDTVFTEPGRVFPLETVEIGEHEIPVVRDPDMPPGAFVLIDPSHVHRAPSMMFASTKASEVDAYVARQAERMGHTEVSRG